MNSSSAYWLFPNYTLCIVLVGTGLLGLSAGALGSFILLRKQSLVGDALSHAALPGIALTFLATQSKNPLILFCGGAITGTIGIFLMHLIVHKSSLKKDTALGIILSVFFGFGLVLLTIIQKYPLGNQSILNKFLFGNASTLLHSDLWLISMIFIIVTLVIILFWKQFKLIAFDQNYLQSIKYPERTIEILMTGSLILISVIGLQTVGVILMSSLLIAPAAAARQWVVRLEYMVPLAGFIGACCTIAGAIVSSYAHHVPTGPAIVLFLSSAVTASLLFSPRRGIVTAWLKNKTDF